MHKRTFADIPIFEFDEVDSTHEVAKQMLETGQIPLNVDGEDLPATSALLAVISAKYQSQGRGRRQRTWSSASGTSMLATFIVQKRESNFWIDVAHIVTVVAKYIRSLGIEISIKWPNDLVVENENMKKLGGCLTEIFDSYLLVGIGINISEGSYPFKLSDQAICLSELGVSANVSELIDQIVDRFCCGIEQDKDNGSVLNDYKDLSATIGRQVQVEQLNGSITGIATDIEIDGSLILQTSDSELTSITEGDVIHAKL